MNPLKAQQKYQISPKLFDSSSVSHPETNSSRLLDSIIIASQISEKISTTITIIRKEQDKICSDLYRTLLLTLQLCIERCVKLFETILGSLPDFDDTPSTKQPTTCMYVRTDSMRKAYDYLSGAALSSPRKTAEAKTATQGVCIPATLLVVGVINKMLIRIDITLSKLKSGYKKSRFGKLKVQTSQFEILANYALQAAVNSDNNSILYKPQDDPEWVRIKPFYVVDDNASEKFEKSYNGFEKNMAIVQAACRTSLKKTSDFGTFLSTGFNTLYYSLFSSRAHDYGELFLIESDAARLSKFWNMLDENPYVRYFFKKLLPSVKLKQVIYTPKMLEPLTIADLTNKVVKEKAEKSVKYLIKQRKYDPEKYVKIRILSEHKLPVNFKTGEIDEKAKAEAQRNIKTVLVHIHGGGFIGLSSRSHQNYLRKWTKMIPNCVIFSIDYRLSPEYAFPAALEDIWQGYYWILTQCESQLGIAPQTILVAGDSAGGNFSMVLTLRALHANVRMPDGVVLGYPALNLSMKSFTPSILVSVDDYMLRYNFLLICINSYIKEGDADTDPFISPINISDEDLARFPPIRMLVCGRDPLRDECYKLLQRKLGKDVFLKEYRNFPHGVWSLDFPLGIDECKYVVADCAKWMSEFITRVRKPEDGVMAG